MHSILESQYPALCCQITRDAGKLIMGYFSGHYTSSKKADASPVTQADIEANQLIVAALRKMAPHIPIVAEEDETFEHENHEAFFLVDPLDGTRSFVSGEGEFTVNIGLIRNRKPVFGVIYAPVQQLLYWNDESGVYRQKDGEAAVAISARKPADDGLVVVRSRSHPSAKSAAYLEKIKIKETISGSSSIKFCQIAEGAADLYPRFGRTMEWDTAAGHAILNAAGGRVETADGNAFTYGKPGFENPAFIAYGR